LSIDPNQVDDLQKLQALVAKAVNDPNFRQRLTQSPVQELNNAGLTVDANVTVTVHVNSPTEIHLVIPSPPPPAPAQPGVLKPFHWF
jgi:hypothetical protein